MQVGQTNTVEMKWKTITDGSYCETIKNFLQTLKMFVLHRQEYVFTDNSIYI